MISRIMANGRECVQRRLPCIYWLTPSIFERKRMMANEVLAESAGVEPARPEGLAALAPRCLAARPTLRMSTCHLSKWSPRRDSNAQPEASDASALVH